MMESRSATNQDQLIAQVVAGREAAEHLATLTARGVESADVRTLAEALIERGVRARNAVVVANLPLVKHIARRYAGRGVAMDDLVSEGTVGLIRAIDRYVPSLGSFAHYAGLWVEKHLRETVSKSPLIPIEPRMYAQICRVRSAARLLAGELGRQPTIAELAERTGLTECRVRDLGRWSLAGDVARLDDLYADYEATVSLCGGADDDSARVTVAVLLATLLDSDTEREVLAYKYGIDEHPEMSDAEIALALGISRAAVRRIAHTALERLRPDTTAA
jgi:DNA-directed RNA polymerase sigma subunit (sigma70/sigma32)